MVGKRGTTGVTKLKGGRYDHGSSEPGGKKRHGEEMQRLKVSKTTQNGGKTPKLRLLGGKKGKTDLDAGSGGKRKKTGKR